MLQIEPLVAMELVANRRENAMHVRDPIDGGLVDQTWTAKFLPELAARLQHLLDTPEG